jgi:hypothetical protein
MKTNIDVVRARTVLSWSLALWLALACKDDDPCDPGQEERSAGACFPIMMAGNAGQQGEAGTDGGGGTGGPGEEADAGGDGAAEAPPAAEAEVGQPCSDTTASSDCGAPAPICAPFPAGAACTQILCLDGEPNAGVCPANAPCITPPGNPSVCFPM